MGTLEAVSTDSAVRQFSDLQDEAEYQSEENEFEILQRRRQASFEEDGSVVSENLFSRDSTRNESTPSHLESNTIATEGAFDPDLDLDFEETQEQREKRLLQMRRKAATTWLGDYGT